MNVTKTITTSTLSGATAALGWVDVAARTQSSTRHLPTEFTRDESFTISGWAVCGSPSQLLDELFFVIDGKHIISASYRLRRDDVAQNLAVDNVRYCGFRGEIQGGELSEGIHTINIAGVYNEKVYRLNDTINISVLGKPEPVIVSNTAARSAGRIRILRDTFDVARHDGRSPSAIRPGASLVIEGWTVLTEPLRIAEQLRILLFRGNSALSVAVHQRSEPEASAAFGVNAAGAGFSAYIDCAPLEPGAYEVGFEFCSAGIWSSTRSGRWIEIMAYADDWLPRALPVYKQSVDADYYKPVPTSVTQGDEILIGGHVKSAQPIAAAFARFNRELTYALTLAAYKDEYAGGHSYEFIGLLQPMLVPAVHTYELLFLAQDRAGTWYGDRGMMTIATPVLSC